MIGFKPKVRIILGACPELPETASKAHGIGARGQPKLQHLHSTTIINHTFTPPQRHHHAALPPPWWLAKMGQGLSCRELEDTELFNAVQNGDIDTVEALAAEAPNLLTIRTLHGRLSALHVAAANGHLEVCFSFIFAALFRFDSYRMNCALFLLGSFYAFRSLRESRYLESPQTGLISFFTTFVFLISVILIDSYVVVCLDSIDVSCDSWQVLLRGKAYSSRS